MWKPALTVAVGAAFGALARWQLSLRLNALFPAIPPGTLLANLVGAYLAGLCAAGLSQTLPAEWRLFLLTGFCGGLTTFSTFSLEIATLLQQDKPGFVFCALTAHLIGSIVMLSAGISTANFLKSFF